VRTSEDNPGSRGGLCLVYCENIGMEVADALAAEGLDKVDVVPLRARCLGGVTQAAAFREQANDLLRRYDRVVAIGGPCVTGEDFSDLWDEGLRIVPTEHCWGPLADGELLSSLIAQGAYVVTPGWLSHWPERMADWGFSQEQAREFFHDCCSSMVLLDTQVDPESGQRLAELARLRHRSVMIFSTSAKPESSQCCCQRTRVRRARPLAERSTSITCAPSSPTMRWPWTCSPRWPQCVPKIN